MALRTWKICLLVVLAFWPLAGAASAAEKIAVFPFDLLIQKSEEDFFNGPKGPTPDEQRRLDTALAKLKELLAADGRYEVVDLSPLSDEIKAAAPLTECNGCAADLTVKAGAKLAMTSVVDKISETHLSLNVVITDVADNKVISNSSVLIQGNTDEAWLHGVRWLAKNRLLAEGK